MIRNLLLLLVLCLGAGLFTYFSDKGAFHRAPAEIRTETESTTFPPAPPTRFPELAGESRDLRDYPGRVVILNFWASWCAPCITEFPQMLRLAAANPDRLVILFVSIDENKKDIERFVQKLPQPLPPNIVIGRDPEQKLARAYQTYKIPESIWIGPEGGLRDKTIGTAQDWAGADMQKKVDSLANP